MKNFLMFFSLAFLLINAHPFLPICSNEGEKCGHTQEGQSKCCEGLVCIWEEDLMPGSPGTCRSPLCSSFLQPCGPLQEGHKPCCPGYICIFSTDILGAHGNCAKPDLFSSDRFKTLESMLGAKNNNNFLDCAKNGEKCGKKNEGQKKCCPGFECAWTSEAGLGSTGECRESF